MSTLSQVIMRAYANRSTGSYHQSTQIPSTMKKYFLEIPLAGETIEVPLFALTAFNKSIKESPDSAEALIAYLKLEGVQTSYKSMEAKVKDTFCNDFSYNLIKLEAKRGTQNVNYFVTHGAVFNENMFPIVMCSWIFQKEYDGNYVHSFKYRFVTPILRIHPDVFIRKEDNLQKFIVGKFLSTVLALTVYGPSFSSDWFIATGHGGIDIKVEISNNPFHVSATRTPYKAVEDSLLRQIALDYKEELIQ